MYFSKPIMDIILERTSNRTYSGQPLEKDLRKKVLNILENLDYESPFSDFTRKARFELVSVPEFDPNEKKKLGTYGLIKGAQDFVVGAIEKSEFAREHYGYLMELIILAATDIGLGTCWIGAFDEMEVKEILGIPNEIRVVALMSIGYPSDPSAVEKSRLTFNEIVKYEHW